VKYKAEEKKHQHKIAQRKEDPDPETTSSSKMQNKTHIIQHP
jgi:hypothetical protein